MSVDIQHMDAAVIQNRETNIAEREKCERNVVICRLQVLCPVYII